MVPRMERHFLLQFRLPVVPMSVGKLATPFLVIRQLGWWCSCMVKAVRLQLSGAQPGMRRLCLLPAPTAISAAAAAAAAAAAPTVSSSAGCASAGCASAGCASAGGACVTLMHRYFGWVKRRQVELLAVTGAPWLFLGSTRPALMLHSVNASVGSALSTSDCAATTCSCLPSSSSSYSSSLVPYSWLMLTSHHLHGCICKLTQRPPPAHHHTSTLHRLFPTHKKSNTLTAGDS